MSGTGRELGEAALTNYSELKTVTVKFQRINPAYDGATPTPLPLRRAFCKNVTRTFF